MGQRSESESQNSRLDRGGLIERTNKLSVTLFVFPLLQVGVLILHSSADRIGRCASVELSRPPRESGQLVLLHLPWGFHFFPPLLLSLEKAFFHHRVIRGLLLSRSLSLCEKESNATSVCTFHSRLATSSPRFGVSTLDLCCCACHALISFRHGGGEEL